MSIIFHNTLVFYAKILLRENEKAFINTVTGKESCIHFHCYWHQFVSNLFPNRHRQGDWSGCVPGPQQLSALWVAFCHCACWEQSRPHAAWHGGHCLRHVGLTWRRWVTGVWTLACGSVSVTEKVSHMCLNFSVWVSHREGESQVSKLWHVSLPRRRWVTGV